jgi:thiol-disulfide isomerase/thioredoxin
VSTPEPAAEEAAPAIADKSGQKAAALEGLTYVKGQPVTLTEGKVYVVEFWATWCPPCRVSIPHLTEIQKQFKDKGVTVIGISTDAGDDRVRTDDDLDTVKAFVAKQGDKMDYTVAWDAKGKADAGYMAIYNPEYTIPFACIVDGKGNIAWFGHPMDGMDEVLALVVAGTYDPAAYAKAKAEAEAAEQRLYALFQEYFTAFASGAPIDQTRPIAEKLIETENPEAMNAMAWQILMQADKPNSDKSIALKAAEKANTLTNGENPMVLDTYALALFENGKVAEAVAAQEKAIVLTAGNEELQADLKTRLEEFKAALNAPERSKVSQ